MSFIEKLLKAKDLKVSHNGTYHKVPDHVLQFNRKLAFQIVGIEPSLKDSSENFSKDEEKNVESTFTQLMEDYFESQVPKENPAYVFDMFGEFVNKFDDKNNPKKIKTWYILKGHIMGLAYFMLYKIMDVKKSSTDKDRKKGSKIGRNFVQDLTDAEKLEVRKKQLYTAIASTWVMCLVENFWLIKSTDFKEQVDKMIENNPDIIKTIGKMGKNIDNDRNRVLKKIKVDATKQLENISLLKILTEIAEQEKGVKMSKDALPKGK